MNQLSVACLSIDKNALEVALKLPSNCPQIALKLHHEIVKNRVGIVNQRENLNPCYHLN